MTQTISSKEFDNAVTVFRAAWMVADARGLEGHRVEAGIRALISFGWAPTHEENN